MNARKAAGNRPAGTAFSPADEGKPWASPADGVPEQPRQDESLAGPTEDRGLVTDASAALATFLSAAGAGVDARTAVAAEAARVDVRRDPLAVRDGCSPLRIPAGRWPADGTLVRSEQFVVNEAIARLDDGGLFAVHAAPGTGVTEVFGDLVAAIVTARARRLAELPDPAAAFGEPREWNGHRLASLAPELAGFEIVLAHPDAAPSTAGLVPQARDPEARDPEARDSRADTMQRRGPQARGTQANEGEATSSATDDGLPQRRPEHRDVGRAVKFVPYRTLAAARPAALPHLGAGWRDQALGCDYFASTAPLADGVGAWAMLAARLGDRAANRAFADRWWHGTVRGTDVLFPTGESMAVALRRLSQARGAVDWQAEVKKFTAALAKAETLAEERSQVAAALTRLSALEQACEEASSAADAAELRLAELTDREPQVREALAAADAEHRSLLADLGAHQLGRPTVATVTPEGMAALRSPAVLSVALAGGLRRGRNLRTWSAERRQLRAACAAALARRDAAAAAAEELRASLAVAWAEAADAKAELARLTAELGPLAESIASARQRWGDHVPDGPAQAETEDAALIEWRETSAPWSDAEYAAVRAEVFLAALALHKALIVATADTVTENLSALMMLLQSEPVAVPDPAAALAAWQTFFLVVPVVMVPFQAIGALFAELGDAHLGWLLADRAETLALRQALAALRRTDRAVLAGDTVASMHTLSTRASAQRIAERNARYGTWLAVPAAEGASRHWVGTPLRVVRGQDRATIDRRNEQTYDGLLIPDRANLTNECSVQTGISSTCAPEARASSRRSAGSDVRMSSSS